MRPLKYVAQIVAQGRAFARGKAHDPEEPTSISSPDTVSLVTTASSPPRAERLLRVELVRVRNFRGITSAILVLDPDLTLLVGQNNAGKSRFLRSIALAFGDVVADRDDFTIGVEGFPEIDVVLAPYGDTLFDGRVRDTFGRQVQPTADGSERISWRTTIAASNEGWGARAERRFLVYDPATNDWVSGSGPSEVTRTQMRAIAADLVGTGRDLAAELSRPGSSIRRVLDDLEVNPSARADLESKLGTLGQEILNNSDTLTAILKRLQELEESVVGVGNPNITALPGRVEELVRLIEVGLDTGSGNLPMRFHGSGSRSLSSLQIQGVLYERRLGRDGSDFPVHPLTLVEEPEAHLHPQASFDLINLLTRLPGQVVVSTHSSHLATVVDIGAIRLIRRDHNGTIVRDMTPIDAAPTTPAALRVDLAEIEWEKIKKLVERPFGEVLFAGAIAIGDGSSERNFFPPLLRKALGARASEICFIDPGAMSQAIPLIKYADAAQIPCVLFMDSDDRGRRDAKAIEAISTHAQLIWAGGSSSAEKTLDSLLVEFDENWVDARCAELLPPLTGTALHKIKQLKGTYGGPMGRAFVRDFENPTAWPQSFRDLCSALENEIN